MQVFNDEIVLDKECEITVVSDLDWSYIEAWFNEWLANE